jgi:hypothetical protein
MTIAATIASIPTPAWASAPQILWVRQFGSDRRDEADAVAIWRSAVYVGGTTYGRLPGKRAFGGADVFIRKFGLGGTLRWTRQFGTGGDDSLSNPADKIDGTSICTFVLGGIAVDDTGLYVTGRTSAAFPGNRHIGGVDVFVRKYSFAGRLIWTREFGTTARDEPAGIGTDGSQVYVAGTTQGSFPGYPASTSPSIFVRSYDPGGGLRWTRQFGTSVLRRATGIAAGTSGIFIAGEVSLSSASNDRPGAFLSRFTHTGRRVWTRRFGATHAIGNTVTGDVDVDTGGREIYTVATIEPRGANPPPSTFALYGFARDAEITFSDLSDGGHGKLIGVARRSVALYTAGDGGVTSAGTAMFVRNNGRGGGPPFWTVAFGPTSPSAPDHLCGVAAGPKAAYAVGDTARSFAGETSSGGADAFVTRIGRT